MSKWFSLVLSLCPVVLSADTYDGVYKQTVNSDCGLVGVDGGAIEIRDGIFYGVEVQCRMERPVNVIDMNATLYDMTCSGEAQFWSERAMLMSGANDDTLIMVWNGYAFVYDACQPTP